MRRGSVTAATMLLVSIVMARGGSRQGRATKVLRMLMAMVVVRVLHGRVRRRGRGAVAAAAGTVMSVGQGWLGTPRRGVARSKGGERRGHRRRHGRVHRLSLRTHAARVAAMAITTSGSLRFPARSRRPLLRGVHVEMRRQRRRQLVVMVKVLIRVLAVQRWVVSLRVSMLTALAGVAGSMAVLKMAGEAAALTRVRGRRSKVRGRGALEGAG